VGRVAGTGAAAARACIVGAREAVTRTATGAQARTWRRRVARWLIAD
jgi:hypothetical protein